MRAFHKSLRGWAEALPIILLQALLVRLPFRAVTRLGAALGGLAFALAVRRAGTLEQLRLAFGGAMTPEERRRIARASYRHFGAMGFQFLAEASLPKAEIADWVTLHDLPLLREALRGGKGVLLASAHLGNWELVGPALNAEGIALSLYVGAQHNPIVDGVINRARQETGSQTVHKGPNVKGLLKALKENRALAILADQHDTAKRHYVAFFGRPVSVPPGPAQLARRTGAPMFFADCTRDESGRYGMRLTPIPVPVTADEERDVLEIMQAYYAALEAAARRRPEQYFWMHRRFRPIPREVTLSAVNRAFLEERLSPGALPPGALPPE